MARNVWVVTLLIYCKALFEQIIDQYRAVILNESTKVQRKYT